jgi:lysophospholipase L1-like esterase
MKKYLQDIALCILTLLIVFTILEIGFRITSNSKKILKSANGKESWAIYDEDLGYRLRPNYGDCNSDGLRDDPISIEKKRFRILFLGDSITYYGDSISDTYVGRLESKLNADAEIVPTSVINAGIRGYTNYQELVYLKKYGLKYEADLVGVSFCLNDLHKFLHVFEFDEDKIVGNGYQFAREAVESSQGFFYRTAKKSQFLVWLRRRLSIFDAMIKYKQEKGYTFDYRTDFNTAWKDDPWELIEEQLQEMVVLGEKHGFRVFLVAFPFGDQLREDYLKRDYQYVIKPQRRLKTICEKLNIAFLDLFNEFDLEKHLLDDNIHLTRQGRDMVAEKIAIFLKQKKLIPNSHSSY